MTPTPPSTTSSSASMHSPEFRVIRKRNRVPLSCAPCRHRKLKCNRSNPCENCVKRGDANSCSYAQTNSRKKNSQQQAAPTSPDDMQNRIDRLEGLVLSLMTNGNQAAGPAAAMAAISGESSVGSTRLSNDLDLDLDLDDDIPEGAEESDTEQVTKSFGVMKVDNNKSYYISPAHWASVLNDITEVRNFFSTHKKQLEEQVEKINASRPQTDVPGSTLLFGVMKPLSRAEILASLPSKYTTDLLVARYFNSYDPVTHILHGPTFQSQYNKHWEDPSQTEVVWIAMLFAMMRLAMLSFYRERDEPPEFKGKAMDMAGSFRNSVAQCLTLADYTKAHPHLIECLGFHLHGDFSQSREADVSVWVLTGVIARLAMRMGYHRDSKMFPNITPFQGEMRRRVWSFVRMLDTLFSFQVGMPSMLRSADSDTDLPRNLYDDDFDEECKELPQSRPLSEPTPIAYMISKARLVLVFGRVNEHASSGSNNSYDKTMEIDADLRRARDMIPEHLRVRPMEDCQLDPWQLLMSRYSVNTVYHKAQIVLHRPYLVRARENPRFTYSRRTCIDSAMEMLGIQATLHAETRNGRLRGRSNPVTSISSGDFLLAATIVSLDLHHGYQLQASGRPSGDTYTWGRERRDEMTAAMQRSKEIWDELRDVNMEAYKASSILGVMLSKLRNTQPNLENSAGNTMFEPQDEKQNAAMTLGLLSSGMSPMNPGPSPFPDPMMRMNDSPMPAGTMGATTSAEMPGGALSPFSSMFGQMPDMQANLDWDAWDNYIQNPAFDASTQFWPLMDPSGQTVQPAGLTQPPLNSPIASSRMPGGIPPMQNGMQNGGVAGRVPSMFSPSSTGDSTGSSVPSQCARLFQSHHITPFPRTPSISTPHARWNSTSNRPGRRQGNAETLHSDETADSKIRYTNQLEADYDLVSEEQELINEGLLKHPEQDSQDKQEDVDYVDLYARSRAAELEEGKGKRKRRLKKLDETLRGRNMPKGRDADDLSQSEGVPGETVSRSVADDRFRSETVYVGNLFWDLTAEDLRAHFEQFGTVVGTTIVHDNRGISKGFGYVQFSTTEEAKAAIDEQNLKTLSGRTVVLQYARNDICDDTKSETMTPSHTLYIGRLPYEMTDRDLQDLFSNVVNVFDIRIPVDRRSGALRGFAHVEFQDIKSAQVGLEVLANKEPYGRKMKVCFATVKRAGMLHSERLIGKWEENAKRGDVDKAETEEQERINQRVSARLAAIKEVGASNGVLPEGAGEK
ncbi:hypothetical protein N7540_009938 [Penicillium herquei]|nr:hypothetical protein N7540_009938 [Penicillium herquei]